MWRRRPMMRVPSGPSPSRGRCASTSTSAAMAMTATQERIIHRAGDGHTFVVGHRGSGKSTTAAARVLWLHEHHSGRRRVLALGRDLERRLDDHTAFYALARRGHRVAGAHEWVRQVLEELGSTRRVLPAGKLAALLIHHGVQELPLRRFHHRLATRSSMQLRRNVMDMIRFFSLLEAHGVTPEEYATAYGAASDEDSARNVPGTADLTHPELAAAYGVYHKILETHDVVSWDGLVLELLMRFRTDPHDAAVATQEFTDVIVDDLDRMTPAMVQLVGLIARQSCIKSTTTFAGLAISEEATCPQMTQLQSLLRQVDRSSDNTKDWEALELTPRPHASGYDIGAFVREVLVTGKTNCRQRPEIDIKTFVFPSFDTEAKSLAKLVRSKCQSHPGRQVIVFCPTDADVEFVTQIFHEHGILMQNSHRRFALRQDFRPQHLFDEPPVNALFSLLVALAFPSDTKYLYNLLRSEYFAFPPILLSRIMERHHRDSPHASLLDVLEAFVSTRGDLLNGRNSQPGSESPDPLNNDLTVALGIAKSFVDIFRECQAQCHAKSVHELVQLFLERTNQVSRLLDPQSPHDASRAIAVAAFLREIDAAQRVVHSSFVPFIVPYLLHLQNTHLSAEDAQAMSLEDFAELETDESHAAESLDFIGKGQVKIFPLTRSGVDKVGSIGDSEADNTLVLLMSMRDTKFPGRLKRITWPLPQELLHPPMPIQSRSQFLDEAQRLFLDALVTTNPSQIIISYAETGLGSTGKRPEKLSRVLLPLWHEPSDQLVVVTEHDGDQPASFKPSSQGSVMDDAASNTTEMNQQYEPPHLSYSQIAEYQRCPQKYYLSRVLRLRDQGNSVDESLALMFGGAVHEALAAFARAQQSGSAIDEARSLAHDALHSAWRRRGFLSKEQESFFIDRAVSSLEAFITDAAECSTPPGIIAVEEEFAIGLSSPSGAIVLRGVWDRIDRVPDGVVIREFKTNPGSLSSSTGRPNIDDVAAESLQLKMYMVAYELAHGVAPKGASLEILGADGTITKGFVDYAPKLHEEVSAVVDSTLTAIRSGDFAPKPGFVECGFCPFSGSVCRTPVESSPANATIVRKQER